MTHRMIMMQTRFVKNENCCAHSKTSKCPLNPLAATRGVASATRPKHDPTATLLTADTAAQHDLQHLHCAAWQLLVHGLTRHVGLERTKVNSGSILDHNLEQQRRGEGGGSSDSSVSSSNSCVSSSDSSINRSTDKAMAHVCGERRSLCGKG